MTQGAIIGGSCALLVVLKSTIFNRKVYNQEVCPPAKYPWTHNGYFDAFDHAR